MIVCFNAVHLGGRGVPPFCFPTKHPFRPAPSITILCPADRKKLHQPIMIDLSTMNHVFTCDGMTRGTAAGTTVWSAKLGLMNL
jgi:hypothetical protein